MTRHVLSAFGLLVAVAVSAAQSPQSPDQSGKDQPAKTNLENMPAKDILLSVEIMQSLDAHSAKPGDTFTARLTYDVKSEDGSRVVAPRGSKVIGHVTEAEPWSKDKGESKIGITFDKVVPKDGPELPLHAAITHAAPPAEPQIRSVQRMSSGDDPMTRAAGPMVDSSGRAIVPSTNANDPLRREPHNSATVMGPPSQGWRSVAPGSRQQQTTAIFLSHRENVKIKKETVFYLRLIAPLEPAKP